MAWQQNSLDVVRLRLENLRKSTKLRKTGSSNLSEWYIAIRQSHVLLNTCNWRAVKTDNLYSCMLLI
jgi:hypothetical protein